MYPRDHQALIPAPAPFPWNPNRVSGTEDPASPERRIFCNRTIDLTTLQAIGFDMDYTLAQYKPETFEHLAYTQTVEKLVSIFKYPEELRGRKFDSQYMMRGLTIDKARGNVIKVDRHKYVKLAYHGFQRLSTQERQALYLRGMSRESFDTDDYTTIDTLFSLAEAYLFMQVVVLKDSTRAYELLNSKTYKSIYRDIRGAMDLCHRDGSLKAAVAADPGSYIYKDEQLVELLSMYREAGYKVFLATNSLWDYTNVVMNFLVHGKEGANKSLEWLQLFDAVMTGCQKPAFFTERNLLFTVDPKTNSLVNTDNGAPILPIDAADPPSAVPKPGGLGRESKIFQGGCVGDLHRKLGVSDAGSVLYVGDHIYGDILKSKKVMGWRTMLIVPELQMEIRHAEQSAKVHASLRELRARRDALENAILRTKSQLQRNGTDAAADDTGSIHERLNELVQEKEEVARAHKRKVREQHEFFHPVWGQMLKAGYQNSMYANLLERFACLYTSHVANLILYHPYTKFRGRVDVMAHEQVYHSAAHGPDDPISPVSDDRV